MKKQLVILGIITLLVCVGLSGCNDVEKNKFLGSWAGYVKTDAIDGTMNVTGSINMTFLSNGTYYGNTLIYWYDNQTHYPIPYNGPWELKNGNLVLQKTNEFLYNFSNNDQFLTLETYFPYHYLYEMQKK